MNEREWVAATLRTLADEVQPIAPLAPDDSRPEGMSRDAWNRRIGASQERTKWAAVLRNRADRLMAEMEGREK